MAVSAYFILGLIGGGIILMLIAWHMDSKSSFNDGSFIVQMFLGIVGAVMVAGALVWR
jgi:hypothetical protein